jgi:hypothetical protein
LRAGAETHFRHKLGGTFRQFAVFEIENKQEGAQMTKTFRATGYKVASVLLLSAPLFLGACAPAPPPAPPPGPTAAEAMDRANAAYALAQQAENDAQAAKVAASTMYQRSLHK